MSYGIGPLGPPPPPGVDGPPGYGPPPGGYGATNPYQPPGAVMGPAGGLVAPPGAAMKWLFLAGHAGYWLFAIGGVVLAAALSTPGSPPDDAAALVSLVPLLGVVFIFLAYVAALVWLQKAWESLPAQMRYTEGGRWVTPGQAAWYNLIPFYNLYWMFVANVGLCDAINRTLAANGAPPRAPKGLAIAACVSQLVPYCNLLVAPILWAVYMFMVDGARREMLARTG